MTGPSRRAPLVLVRAARGLGRHAGLARRIARAALRECGELSCELSLALVDDREMRDLNRSFRGKDRPTDVLAFAQREGEDMPAGAPLGLLGDVVLSVPTAERQAAARSIALEGEIATLLVHGILHLLGYDHERSPAEARRMFRRQREVLAAIAPALASPPAAASRRRAPTSRRGSLADRRAAR